MMIYSSFYPLNIVILHCKAFNYQKAPFLDGCSQKGTRPLGSWPSHRARFYKKTRLCSFYQVRNGHWNVGRALDALLVFFQQLGWLVLLLSHRHVACKISMVVIVWYWTNPTWIRWTPRNTGWTLEIRHAPLPIGPCESKLRSLSSQEPCETDLQWVRPMRGSICNMQKNGLFTVGLSWNLSCFVQKWGSRMFSFYPKMTMKKRRTTLLNPIGKSGVCFWPMDMFGISGKLD